MKLSYFFLPLFVLFLTSNILVGQNTSAIVDYESDNQGVLIPRMTPNQWISIIDPAEGLMVYDSVNHSFYFFNGDNWQTFNTGPKGDPGKGVTSITSVDNMNGSFNLKFVMTDGTEMTITTPILAGPKGDKGDTGMTGAAGMNGMDGAKGDKGDKGDTGMTGAAGMNGMDGAKGDKGDKGDFPDIDGPFIVSDDSLRLNIYDPLNISNDSLGLKLRTPLAVIDDSLGLNVNSPLAIVDDSLNLNIKAPLVIINDSLQIDTAGVAAGKVLKFNGNNWAAEDVLVQVGATSGLTGANRSFDIRDPFLGVYHSIALLGIYPSRSLDPFIGQIQAFGFNFAPRGWSLCDGQLLAISSNTALFSLIGTTFGGDGRTTFGLPDLRGRTAVHVGRGPGLSNITWGQRGGRENVNLTIQELPAHNHIISTTVITR